jgi:hypothetical protein
MMFIVCFFLVRDLNNTFVRHAQEFFEGLASFVLLHESHGRLQSNSIDSLACVINEYSLTVR